MLYDETFLSFLCLKSVAREIFNKLSWHGKSKAKKNVDHKFGKVNVLPTQNHSANIILSSFLKTYTHTHKHSKFCMPSETYLYLFIVITIVTNNVSCLRSDIFSSHNTNNKGIIIISAICHAFSITVDVDGWSSCPFYFLYFLV